MNLYRLLAALALVAVVATGAVRQAAAAAPVAQDDAYSVKEQAVSWIEKLTVAAPGVLANDFDSDGDPIFALQVPGSAPAHGSITYFNADGSFKYVPDPGYTGTDSFQYVVNDGQTDSVPATVTMTVFPNTPPVANSDLYSVAEGGTLQIPAPGILGNDTDADGDLLTVNGYALPSHGDLVMNTDGSFTYTPSAGFDGQDGFGYSAWDGTSISNQASVTITVIDNPPDAVDDSYNTPQDTPLQIDAPGVLGNDSDPDGDPLTSGLWTAPLHGSINYLDPDGSFRYEPNSGYSGTDSFTYRLSDDSGNEDYATVTVNVDPAPGNHAPVANDDSYTFPDDQTSFAGFSKTGTQLLANDSDADGDQLSAQVLVGLQHGVFNDFLPDGSFHYTPFPGFVGDDSFTYQASDGTDLSNVATVTIHVIHNDPPVAIDDAFATPKDTPITIARADVFANDSDPDGDPFEYDHALLMNPAHGTRKYDSVTGDLTYTPDPGFVGTDTIRYGLWDGLSVGNDAYITITVVDADDATATPSPDPSGTPDPDPTGTPTGDPNETPTPTPTDTPDGGSPGTQDDETPTATPDDPGSDSSDDDPTATPPVFVSDLPRTGTGHRDGMGANALPLLLLAIGACAASFALHRRPRFR